MAYAGFDTGSFPGISTMEAWIEGSPYAWVAYYLPAPCHSTKFSAWIGNRQALQDMGWGLAVVYVGRQLGLACGREELSRSQGVSDGLDAAKICIDDGFAAESTVFLDVEPFDEPMTGQMSDYVRGWVHAVAQQSPFRVGIYLHHKNFVSVNKAAATEFAAVGRAADAPRYWVTYEAEDSGFDIETSLPSDCGVAAANVWQGLLDLGAQTYGGCKTATVDENVADWADPSAP